MISLPSLFQTWFENLKKQTFRQACGMYVGFYRAFETDHVEITEYEMLVGVKHVSRVTLIFFLG